MTERLKMILFTLDKIEVRGEENMSRMLGCMAEIKNILKEQEESGNEVHAQSEPEKA